MSGWLRLESLGNASSIHAAGQEARRLLEESRERLAAVLGCDPIEVVFTSGGTESVNLAIKGLWWGRTPGTDAVVMPDGEHHATVDTVGWIVARDGAAVREVALDPLGAITGDAFAAALDGAALATALVANNEVGTVNDGESLALAAAGAGIPLHLDAVSAFGHVPVSFSRWRADASGPAGLVALSVSAHKVGGPAGVGALVVAREASLAPLVHGGGQQRGLRAGTQDVAGAAAFATAAELALAELDAETARLTGLRDRLVRGILSSVEGAELLGSTERRLPGNAHVLFPGASGETLLFLLDQRGIAVSTGSACQAGVARAVPRRARAGADGCRGPPGRPAHARPHLDRGRCGGGAGRAASRRREGAGCGIRHPLRSPLVDWSDADPCGDEWRRRLRRRRSTRGRGGSRCRGRPPRPLSRRGSSRTGSRGCCTIEDAMDARRAADRIGIPFYVWDFSERFREDVIEDFITEYSAGRTPNPCMRCNEKIKFAALLERAIELGFDAVCTGHYATLVDGPDGRELHRASDAAKDQSYVLGVLTAEQLAHTYFPLGATPSKALVRAEVAERGLTVAQKPDSHDICFIPDGDTRGWLAGKVGTAAGDIVDRSGVVVGAHDGAHAFTVGQRRGLSLGVHADTTTNPGLANSDGWIECPPIASQRRAPLISGPRKCTATMPSRATANSPSANRRTPRGENSDTASMINTPTAEKNRCRSTK